MALSTSRTVLTQTGINTFLNYDIGGLNSAGIATFSNFKTGTTDVHSVGVNAATMVVGSAVTSNSDGIEVTGIVTATSFVGSGSGLTGVASTDNIKTSTTANFSDGIQVGGSTTLTGALSATTATANLIVVGSAVTVNSQGIDVTGVITATSFSGIDSDKISEGNTEVETVDIGPGSDGHIKMTTDGTEKVRVTNQGRVGIGTTNPSNFVHIESDGNVQLMIDSNTTSGNTDECGVLFAASGTTKSHFGLSVDPARGVGDANASDTFIKTIGTQAIRLSTDSTTRCVVEGSSGITNFQKAVGIGSYTTTQRDAIAYLQSGTLIFNNSTGTVQIWDGSVWSNLTEQFSASGGTKTTSGSKTIHTFTSSGTFTVTSNSANVRALIVGGGGAGGGQGGNDGSGGGGGGLVRFVTAIPVSPSPGSYPIVIGAGGGATGSNTLGVDGSSSSAFGNTSPGGGGGGSEAPGPRAGRPGGCGGGGGGYGGGGGTGSGDPGAPTDTDLETDGNTPSNGWGNDGGANAYPGGMNYGGGGGGGAQHYGMPGKNPNSVPTQYAMHTYSGNGGNGVGYSISGSPGHYAGGGGCGGNGHHGNNGPGSYGGRGGGGNGGGGPFGSANSGTSGTGGGGGGASSSNSPAPNHNSGGGGSGIVIIDYDTP